MHQPSALRRPRSDKDPDPENAARLFCCTVPGQVLVVDLGVKVGVKGGQLVHTLGRLVTLLLGSLPS